MPHSVKLGSRKYLCLFPMLLSDGSPSGANDCGAFLADSDEEALKEANARLSAMEHSPKLIRLREVVQERKLREVFPEAQPEQVTDEEKRIALLEAKVAAYVKLIAKISSRVPAGLDGQSAVKLGRFLLWVSEIDSRTGRATPKELPQILTELSG